MIHFETFLIANTVSKQKACAFDCKLLTLFWFFATKSRYRGGVP